MVESQFAIRRATPADASDICVLVRELAEYERLAHEANPDPDSLATHLNADAEPRCHALLAVSSDEPIGFALYYWRYSTFVTGWGVHLEDLFVRPSFRGRGVGDALIAAVGRDALDNGGNRLELNVLDWNTSAIDFYLKRGATFLHDWRVMRFAGAALHALARRPSTS